MPIYRGSLVIVLLLLASYQSCSSQKTEPSSFCCDNFFSLFLVLQSCWSWPSEIKEVWISSSLKPAFVTIANEFILFQMPDELVSAYDWTIPLEKEMMENVHSKSQKVLQLYFEQIYSGIRRSTRQTVIFESEHIV